MYGEHRLWHSAKVVLAIPGRKRNIAPQCRGSKYEVRVLILMQHQNIRFVCKK
jgi:hypothetical protein